MYDSLFESCQELTQDRLILQGQEAERLVDIDVASLASFVLEK